MVNINQAGAVFWPENAAAYSCIWPSWCSPMGWWPQATSAAPKPPPAAAFNPEKNFTITKIEPVAAKEEVRIHFSQPVPIEVLQSYLRFLPRLKVDWSQSSVTPEGVAVIKANFKYGAGHFVTLKEGVAVQGRTYFPTVTTFMMPNRPPTVEFVGDKRVIERDSQQLVHVKVANVDNISLGQVRVPPLLLPQALAAEKSGADLKQTAGGVEHRRGAAKTPRRGQKRLRHLCRQRPWKSTSFSRPGVKKTASWPCPCP